jgi:HEPN domain-containing protein
MDEAKRELVQSWLLKAHQDVLSARKLAEGLDPILATAIYHCQQAAEKSLKGVLVFHDQRFAKTHDLEVLLALAVDLEPNLSAWIAPTDRMTEYVAVFRYPGDVLEPSQSEFDQALRDAESLYALVLQVLPPSVHP